jgi:hypothetical protein
VCKTTRCIPQENAGWIFCLRYLDSSLRLLFDCQNPQKAKIPVSKKCFSEKKPFRSFFCHSSFDHASRQASCNTATGVTVKRFLHSSFVLTSNKSSYCPLVAQHFRSPFEPFQNTQAQVFTLAVGILCFLLFESCTTKQFFPQSRSRGHVCHSFISVKIHIHGHGQHAANLVVIAFTAQ